ncbi:DUF924 family protein [Nereida sp. MMG025]|uniref:DUF924 family protein n=1 Tax=Nereida sp. MMG025 TaxID=2909981 RepID=UPI001F3347B0|nr:DUF924 family protein [Nereida sp. MMG025]MCF6443639.1 DUF924 domain-containing protein [Nereida sp. MMG025]
MTKPEDVLAYWIDEIGPKGWYAGGEVLDAEITLKFRTAWNELMDGGMSMWLTYPSGTLAYIILADQFSRNMFRGSAQAFASDRQGLAAAKAGIDKGWDMRIDEPARQFFYLPLMHSENLCDQERSVRLVLTRMPDTGADNLLHARAHREVIRRFGRFPYRNDALERAFTAHEEAFIEEGGYGQTLQQLQA